jgi:TolB-like protein/Flp pilus assembly protein TadD
VNSAAPAEQVRAELERILASQAFKNAERLKRFLRFVVEEALREPDGLLKEHRVAMQVFDRPESFDPRADSVVRIAARQLRFKLRDYYEAEGRGDELRIELPKGSYVPVFSLREAAPAVTHRTWRAWLLAAVGALAVTGAVFLLVRSRLTPPITAVAVLPFRTLGNDAELQHLSEGLVDELTGELSKRAGLRVLARTSASRFQGAQDVGAIGRQARVGALVEGSIRRDGPGLRVSAQLIGTADGYHLWSQTQTFPPERIPEAVQSIAASMARALLGRNAGAVPAAPARLVDAAALRLYWKGRYLRRQRSVEAMRESAECFEQAAAKDPQFAAAWAALADVHAAMSFHQIGGENSEEAIAQARAALDKAMQSDSTVAQAYGTRGFIRFFHDWDWNGAEQDFRRALTLNPSYAKVHSTYALLLLARNRMAEALGESRAARDLDPLSYVVSVELGVALYIARRYGESMRFARETLAVDNSFTPARALLGMGLSATGKYEDGIKELEAAARGSERYSYLVGRMGYAHARLGHRREAEKLIAELTASPEPSSVSLVHVAYIYTGLNQKSRALDLLEQACVRRDADACFIGVEPVLEPLRSEPRFAALLTRYAMPRQ